MCVIFDLSDISTPCEPHCLDSGDRNIISILCQCQSQEYVGFTFALWSEAETSFVMSDFNFLRESDTCMVCSVRLAPHLIFVTGMVIKKVIITATFGCLPAMDMCLVYHTGRSVLLSYGLRGRRRLSDRQHLVDGLHLRWVSKMSRHTIVKAGHGC